jgi:hypothetical protein
VTFDQAVSRRRRAALVALPIAVGLVVAAPLAQAAINGPSSSGIQYTQNTTIGLSAHVSSGTGHLALTDPNKGTRVVTGDSSNPSYSFDTGCYPDCNAGSALNGTWTVTLSGGESDSKTLVLKIPPKTPQSVNAQLTASREITLTWNVGPEPDLTGWTVLDGGGGALRQLSRSDCSRTCQAVFGYNADDEGDRSFSVVAHRAVCPSCADALDSPHSSTVTATLPPKPAPSPTPAPTPSDTPAPAPTDSPAAGSGGASGGGPASPAPTSSASGKGGAGGGTLTHAGGGAGAGGATSGGPSAQPSSSPSKAGGPNVAIGSGTKVEAVQAQRLAFALSFSSFAPKLGIAKLPPLPVAIAPTLASDGGEVGGAFQTTLGYKDVVKREKVTTVSQAASALRGALSGALDVQRLMPSIAGALILLLLGAHLRRWLAQSR